MFVSAEGEDFEQFDLLFRIGLSLFKITFQLHSYLTVYCNKRIKTQCQSLTQTILKLTQFKTSHGTYDSLRLIS